jgi:hypothetical protein
MLLSENGGKLRYTDRAKDCQLIKRMFYRGDVLVTELKLTFSPVDKASKNLRHNPSDARIPVSAALRTKTRSQIKDSFTASTPELDELGGQTWKIRRSSLRLRQPMHGQRSIAGPGDERS